MLSELLKKLRGDRVGLVFFAGSAYLQMPLSNDFASAETFIRSANPSQAGTQGTVIADAIELSQTIFGDDSPSQKALIIVSDGENHETEAVEAAQEAFDNGIYTFTLGIGTEEGANIPVIKGGKRFLKRDNEGQAVVSSLNVNNLQNIAEAGGGKFFLLNNSSSVLSQLERELERLKKKEVEQRSFTDYNSYFQYFIFMAILALSVELLLSTLKGTSDKLKSILTR
jgi:Ca-activated chloride channel homolog